MGLPLGMIGNFTACMYAFAEGSTYLATVSGTLAGLVGGASFLFLPWTGIQSTYLLGAENPAEGLAEFYKGAGMVFFIALIPMFLVFLASFRTSAPIALACLFIVVALGCVGGGYIHGLPNRTVLKAGGAFLIIDGVLLFYSALSVMLKEEGWGVLPVIPLPRID